jgi:hypothetical protein
MLGGGGAGGRTPAITLSTLIDVSALNVMLSMTLAHVDRTGLLATDISQRWQSSSCCIRTPHI